MKSNITTIAGIGVLLGVTGAFVYYGSRHFELGDPQRTKLEVSAVAVLGVSVALVGLAVINNNKLNKIK